MVQHIYALERMVAFAQKQAELASQEGVSLQGVAWADEAEQLSYALDELKTPRTRQEIADFQRAFERPLNHRLQESLPVEDRVLLAKLLLEETVEYVVKGLGLKVYVDAHPEGSALDEFDSRPNDIEVTDVGAEMNVIECADGLGDVNVVAHFNAHWHGMNLDRITTEIHRSNMSKLDENGEPIINGVTPGYRCKGYECEDGAHYAMDERGFDPTKPVGKILKSPNFKQPDLGPILQAGNWI